VIHGGRSRPESAAGGGQRLRVGAGPVPLTAGIPCRPGARLDLTVSSADDDTVVVTSADREEESGRLGTLPWLPWS
jgi:hypothetical protein